MSTKPSKEADNHRANNGTTANKRAKFDDTPREARNGDIIKILDSDDELEIKSFIDSLLQNLQQKNSTHGDDNTGDDEVAAAHIVKRLRGLIALEEVLKGHIQKEKNELQPIQERISPIRLLNGDTCGIIISFLGDENLLPLDGLFATLDEAVLKRWQYLHTKRRWDTKSKFGANNARESEMRFAQVASYAGRMERSAAIHYGSDGSTKTDYAWPDSFYTQADYEQDFNDFIQEGQCPSDIEFFVRLSYEADDGTGAITLLEGFRSDFLTGKYHEKLVEELFVVNATVPEKTYMRMLHTAGAGDRRLDDLNIPGVKWERSLNYHAGEDLDRWPEADREFFFKKASLTIVACRGPGIDALPKLVVATSGYYDSKEGISFFSPRSRLADERTADIADCVNTGISLLDSKNQYQGYQLIIEWGDYSKV